MLGGAGLLKRLQAVEGLVDPANGREGGHVYLEPEQYTIIQYIHTHNYACIHIHTSGMTSE